MPVQCQQSNWTENTCSLLGILCRTEKKGLLNMRKLTENQTLHLIHLYKENSCLWDISLDAYRNRAMRQSALEKICQGMQIENLSADDVKSKIKSIRSTYYLELDKIEKATVIGAVYEPKLKWFAEFDSFIKNVIVKRKAREYYIDNTEFEHVEESEEVPFRECEVVSPPPEPRRKRSRISQLSKMVSNVEETQYDLTKPDTEDEFDIFGKHVAKQLRELSRKQSILGQEEIQGVITKRRLYDLKLKTKRYWKHNSSNPGAADEQMTDDSGPVPTNICIVKIPTKYPVSKVDIDSDDD